MYIKSTSWFQKLKQIVENDVCLSGRVFNIVSLILVMLSLIAFTVETGSDLSETVKIILQVSEVIIITLFCIEYFLRIIVAKY